MWQKSTEKPYQFVPFPTEQPLRKEGAGQDRIQKGYLSGWLELELVTLSPLQVATGITDFVKSTRGEQLALTQVSMKRRDASDPSRMIRATVLPGSSLKGAVRSLVEALSPSCVPIVSSLVLSTLPRHLTRCTDVKRLCPACRLFGMSGGEKNNYIGQVSISDAQVPPGNLSYLSTPLLWAPARSRGRSLPPRYLSQGKAKGRKLYEHRRAASGPDPRFVIKEGVTIPTRLYFTNLSEAELGLLIAALGNHPQYPFPIKIGAGKPVGMGSVEVQIKAAVLLAGGEGIKQAGRLGGAMGKAERVEGDTLKGRLAQWAKKAEQQRLLLTEQLKEVAKVLAKANLSKPAPSGAY